MSILSDISKDVLMTESEILNFSSTAPRRYKRYYILKRNGKDLRLIAHPSKEVKFFQRLVISKLDGKLPIHHCAMAYVKGKSIKDNADAHKKNKYLLKMDFKNFFMSVTPELFISSLKKNNIILDTNDLIFLEGILFWKLRRNSPLRLSVGAPSSPFISNFIMKSFDDYIFNTCKEMNVTYTRYADDITFSTNIKTLLFTFPVIIKNALKEHCDKKIRINSEKTIFTSKKFNRHITGITINNNNNLSLGRNKKRLISSMVHHFISKDHSLTADEILKLKGHLSFAHFIEPDFIQRLSDKYGNEEIINIIKHI
ncbi:RNA-directed DNA polymerase [Photobacterium carnosum]|uniref:retron St85 family RNA-directed DNA polymerase n=1 Tax=Photobacterium carnosum TaxID=2023717 RepID=UPI001E3F3627|nr:retron St85 family RNA-directed DNA polymerase [Photobacterium carnosum]MCD9524201.1 RNA-directed DNA polymerase [Photobacterium carnosum]